jgi:hypothetical protein
MDFGIFDRHVFYCILKNYTKRNLKIMKLIFR